MLRERRPAVRPPDGSGERGGEQAVVGESPRRPQEAEGADVLEPGGERRPARERPAADDPGEAAERRLGQLGDGLLGAQRGVQRSRRGRRTRPRAARPRRPARRASGRARRASTRPARTAAASSAFGSSCRLAVAIASSRTPRITAVNTLETSGAAASVRSSSGPSQARRIAGHASSRIAWLWVAAMPMPSHSAISRSPAVPSHGRSRTSRTKSVGCVLAVGDRGRDHERRDARAAAEVLVAADAVGGAGQRHRRTDPSGVACALVRRMSPPLPGSEVIVPHCAPSAAVAKTACAVRSTPVGTRPAGPARSRGPPGASTRPGRPTGSAAASVRSVSQIGRVVSATLRQSPPVSSGTATMQEAGLRQSREVGGVETAASLPLGTVRPPLARRCPQRRSPAPTMKRS